MIIDENNKSLFVSLLKRADSTDTRDYYSQLKKLKDKIHTKYRVQ